MFLCYHNLSLNNCRKPFNAWCFGRQPLEGFADIYANRFSRPIVPLLKHNNHMFKAISGALSLLLTILVLEATLPDVATQVIELITKILHLANAALDSLAQSQNI